MRLYHHPISTCARRVLLLARHLGIDLDLVVVDLGKGAQHAPEFLALNPNHRVPVLEHDGFVLWESYAIMQYLADTADSAQSQALYPREPKARADVNRWLFWCAQDFAPGISLLNWEHSIKPMVGAGEADAAQVALGEGMVTKAAAVLDAHLAGRDWVCDAALSLADFAIAAPLADEARAKLPLGEYANLQRWLERVKSLEAWKQCEVPGWDMPVRDMPVRDIPA